MAINFPDSPTNGQIFTSGTSSWTYDGVKWNLNTNTTTSNDSMPVGSILWFANTTTTPPGWVAADGSAISRTTYATLFASISTTYGSGDGSTTFNVPSVAATTGKYFIRYTTSVGTVTTTSLATSPVGTMLDWPVTSSYPTGFLRADGSAVSRTSYTDLFALIGTTYGTGDGSTTFNLPNLVAAGSGSPVKIIKASLGGTVEPSTVAHASSHAAGGSDPVSIKQSQINDFVFTTEAARDAAITSPVEGMRAYITAPTIPAATCGTSGYTAIPSGIQTIYNGSTWVCITPIGTGNMTTCTAQSISSYGTALWSGTAMTIVSNTGSSALVTLTARVFAANANYFFAAVKPGSGSATDGYSISIQQSTGSTANAIGGSWIFTGLPANTNTFTVQMRNNGASSMYLDQCHLTVQGVA
jgi:microcystin-dependent protein